MKPVLYSLKLGQRVFAVVEEVLEKHEIIVNFQGDLLRVANQTARNFRAGQRIQLAVTSIAPLGFKLMESRSNEQRHLVDYTI